MSEELKRARQALNDLCDVIEQLEIEEQADHDIDKFLILTDVICPPSSFDSPGNAIRMFHCPVCDYEYVHFDKPEYRESQNDYSAQSAIWSKGDVIDIPMWCESGHKWHFEISFHKGKSFGVTYDVKTEAD